MAKYILDSGTYFIGDISKVLSNDKWNAISTFKNKVVHWIDQFKFIKFDVSNKEVVDNDGHCYVLGETLGIVNIGCIDVSVDDIKEVPYGRLFRCPTNFVVEGKRKSILINDQLKFNLVPVES